MFAYKGNNLAHCKQFHGVKLGGMKLIVSCGNWWIPNGGDYSHDDMQ